MVFVAPGIFVKVVPSVLVCHCTVGVGVPVAVAVSIFGVPAINVLAVGSVVGLKARHRRQAWPRWSLRSSSPRRSCW